MLLSHTYWWVYDLKLAIWLLGIDLTLLNNLSDVYFKYSKTSSFIPLEDYLEKMTGPTALFGIFWLNLPPWSHKLENLGYVIYFREKLISFKYSFSQQKALK